MIQGVARIAAIILMVVVLDIAALKPTWAATPAPTVQTTNKTAVHARNYPGGRDEDDLRVQEVLVPPTPRIDRKSLDSKVIKDTTGKSEEDDDQPVEE